MNLVQMCFLTVFAVSLAIALWFTVLCLWDVAKWTYARVRHELWLRQCARIIREAECEQLNRLLDGGALTPQMLLALEREVDSVEALMRREQRP